MKRRIYKSINVYIIFIHFLIKKNYTTNIPPNNKTTLFAIQSITLIHMKTSELPNRSTCQKKKSTIIGFHPGPTCDLFPVTISKNLCSPSSLIAISNFKKEKMIHFAQIPSPQCESYDEPRKTIPSSTEQSTNQPLDSQNSQKHRPKSRSGSFEAE